MVAFNGRGGKNSKSKYKTRQSFDITFKPNFCKKKKNNIVETVLIENKKCYLLISFWHLLALKLVKYFCLGKCACNSWLESWN